MQIAATASVIITEPIAFHAFSTSAASCGNSDGSATATATGGIGGFNYL